MSCGAFKAYNFGLNLVNQSVQSSFPPSSNMLIPCVNFWFIACIPVNRTVFISTLSFTIIPRCSSSKLIFSSIPTYSSGTRIVKTLRIKKTIVCKITKKLYIFPGFPLFWVKLGGVLGQIGWRFGSNWVAVSFINC